MVLLLMAMAFAVQDDAAAAEAIAAYEAAFPKAKDADARAALVGTLAQTQHELVLPKLDKALSHADKPVRLAAVQGMKGYSGGTPAQKKSATKALMNAIGAGVNAKDVDVKEAIVAALGALQEDLAIATIKVSLDDKSLKVSVAAVSAAAAMKHKDLIGPLISLLQESEKTLRAAGNPSVKGRKPVSAKKDANDPEELKTERAGNLIPPILASLETLTGQKYGTGDEWDRWWTKARPNFQIKKE